MNEPIIIEDQPMPAEMANLFEKAKRNRLWLNEHLEELEIYKRYRGCFVGAAGGELFVADTPEQIEQLVKEKYPDDIPHIRYIRRK